MAARNRSKWGGCCGLSTRRFSMTASKQVCMHGTVQQRCMLHPSPSHVHEKPILVIAEADHLKCVSTKTPAQPATELSSQQVKCCSLSGLTRSMYKYNPVHDHVSLLSYTCRTTAPRQACWHSSAPRKNPVTGALYSIIYSNF